VTRLAAAILMLAALASPGAAAPEIEIVGSEPGLSGSLGLNRALYLRLAYQSDVAIRVQAHGYRAGAEVTDGVRFNPSPAYPAGGGEAMVWIAFAEAVRIDEIRIEVADDRWAPLLVARVPVDLRWAEEAAAEGALPAWVERLDAEQQNAVSDAVNSGGGRIDALIGTVFVYGVPVYLALQLLLALRYRGGWRIAALLPFPFMLLALVYVSLAVAAGSNIAPVILVFAAPPFAFYLGCVALAHRLARGVRFNPA
jgi:hypothetical protein